jgi:hypothetical protein
MLSYFCKLLLIFYPKTTVVRLKIPYTSAWKLYLVYMFSTLRHPLGWTYNSMAMILTNHLNILYGRMALAFDFELEQPKEMDTRDAVEFTASCLLDGDRLKHNN